MSEGKENCCRVYREVVFTCDAFHPPECRYFSRGNEDDVCEHETNNGECLSKSAQKETLKRVLDDV